MSVIAGCLLLLAVPLLQRISGTVRMRGVLGALVVSGAWLALVRPAATPAGTLLTIGTLGSFWIACAAVRREQRRVEGRLDALTELCDVDEATGCLNRRGFSRHLERAASASRTTGVPVALLALDLDHFKQVNDRFGHLAGDAVLSEVSASLRDAVGGCGVVARLGGEEFAVLLPEADEEAAGVMAERVVAALRVLRLQALPPEVRLTMSAGIAAERMDGPRAPDALRARADEALYAAKRSGRGRALLWAPGVHSHATPIRAGAAIVR